MLMGGLYALTDLQHQPEKVTATVTLDANHPVFAGHYPGQPVLPGACMLQIIKDVLEQAFGRSLVLKQASQMKFLQMIDPRESTMLNVSLSVVNSDDVIKVSGSLVAGDKPCFKFTGSFVVIA